MPIMFFILILVGLAPFRYADGTNASPEKGLPTTLVAPPWSHTFGLHRVRQTHLDIYTGYRKRFSSPQGLAAIKHDFNDEESPNDDDELTVYGVNAGEREIIFNKSRFSLGFFEGSGSGGSDFVRPVGIAADREGWVAVADQAQNKVLYLQNESNELKYVRSVTFEDSEKPLAAPMGLAIENGRLYIADSENHRVVVTDRNGTLLETIGTDEKRWHLFRPFDVAVIAEPSYNYYQSKFIIVSDSLNQRLCKLAMNGVPLTIKRFKETAGDFGGFFFVAVDYYSNVYATDTLAGCVYKFDRHLNYLARLGCGEEETSALEEPRGIAIYRRFGQVFVAERAGASYYWIGTDVLNPSAEAELEEGSASITIRFLLTEHARLTVSLEDEAGATLHIFDSERFISPGNKTRIYHLKDGSLPCSIAKCKSYVTIVATPTYASKRFLTVNKRVPVRVK